MIESLGVLTALIDVYLWLVPEISAYSILVEPPYVFLKVKGIWPQVMALLCSKQF